MWSIVVAMPAVQAEFAVDRGAASLPYTAAMIGLMTGTVVIGRLSDRFGLMRPAMGAVVLLACGYVATAFAPGITSYAVLYGALVGVGGRSEEHTSELQSLKRITYAVFGLKKKNTHVIQLKKQ